jgi:hypothetical protein
VSVSIEPEAKLVRDGAVRAVVVASCDPGQVVLEASLFVSDPGTFTSGEAGIPVRCDGKLRRYKVTVAPLEGAFAIGEGAIASAFVLTCTDPMCTTTEQGQATRNITIR